jgi:hypothetical protein
LKAGKSTISVNDADELQCPFRMEMSACFRTHKRYD